MFLDNKYTTWYRQIVHRAKTRDRLPTSYTERHHIIPKCLGGDNTKDNLVNLTAREHFICHWLLVKMTSGQHKHKMLYALSSMSRSPLSLRYSTRITSRVFESLKIDLAIVKSLTHTGKTISKEHRHKISEANRNSHLNPNHATHVANRIAGRTDYSISDETKAKISARLKGKVFTEEHKLKLKVAWKKRKSTSK